MTTTIYYFSGTGNSLAVAKDLTSQLEDCTLIPIARAIKEKQLKPNSNKIGVVFPVYGWGLPALVAEFINKLDISDIKYCFGIATLAGSINGGAIKQLQRILNKKGGTLNFGNYIKMPNNYLVFPNPTSQDNISTLIKLEKAQIDSISEMIKHSKSHIQSSFFIDILARLIYPIFLKSLPGSDKNLHTDEKCNGCGICQKICPVQNIELIEGKPVWKHHCEQCMACIQLCPQEAIQWKNKTQKIGRYHHPETTIKEFIINE